MVRAGAVAGAPRTARCAAGRRVGAAADRARTDLATALARVRRPAPPPGRAGRGRPTSSSPTAAVERPFPWEQPLRRMAAAHETLVVEVVDPRELELPDVGTRDLRGPRDRTPPRGLRRRTAGCGERYASAAAAHRDAAAAAVRAARAGHVLLRTDRDWVRDLARHVNGRPMRPGGRRRPDPRGLAR